MSALTVDEQIAFDIAVALKKVKVPGFRKALMEEGRFEVAKVIVEQSRSRKSAQDDKWSFCLTAGTLCPSNQERP